MARIPTLEELQAELEELESAEPECTCARAAADYDDANGCEYHDDASDWNRTRVELAALVERGGYFILPERKPVSVAVPIEIREVA